MLPSAIRSQDACQRNPALRTVTIMIGLGPLGKAVDIVWQPGARASLHETDLKGSYKGTWVTPSAGAPFRAQVRTKHPPRICRNFESRSIQHNHTETRHRRYVSAAFDLVSLSFFR
jgi:hypothetical protein